MGTHRSLICLAMVKKACSTFVAFFAEVSKKGMFSWSANSYETTGQGTPVICDSLPTFATPYSTTFLLVKSDLLPTSSLLTPSDAYRSISWSHCLTFVKESITIKIVHELLSANIATRTNHFQSRRKQQ